MKVILSAVLATISLVLGGCVFPGSKLGPGDKVGDMELTTEFDINIHDLCSFDELGAGTCVIPVSVQVLGVSVGWSEDTQEALDAAWASSKWELAIDGRPIDLDAFGTFDLDWGEKRARVWDVGLIGITPGEHLARYEFFVDESFERGNHEQIYQFTVAP